MQDREWKVSQGSAVTWGLWGITAIIAITALVTTNVHLGIFGATFSVTAGVAHVRLYLVRQSHDIRNAFELGRDSALQEAGRTVPLQRANT